MICDPGSILISEVIKQGFSITALPGACAVTTFLSQVPRSGEEFLFVGFIPRTDKQIESIVTKHKSENIVFYDSPERILKTLKCIQACRTDARIAIGRELSKLFEEVAFDDIETVINHFKDGIKGEIVCMLYAETASDTSDITDKISILRDKGFKNKEISLILSSLYNYNKNDVYKLTL